MYKTHALVFLFHLATTFLHGKIDKCVRIPLLDFSKTFDRINHQILITKVKEIDIDLILIEWGRYFLTVRKQPAKIRKFIFTLE